MKILATLYLSCLMSLLLVAHDGHHGAAHLDANFAKQIDYYQKRIQKNEQDFVSLYKLSELYLNRARATASHGDFKLAYQTFERVLELQPQHFAAMLGRAYAASGQHQFEHALKLAREVAIYHHREPATALLLADVYFGLGRYAEAEAFVSNLPKEHAAFDINVRQAQLHEVRGNPVKAEKLLQASLATLPETQQALERRVWVHTMLGDLHFRESNVAAAQQAFEKAISLNPDHFYAHWRLGMLQSRTGQGHAALTSLARANTLAGNRTGVWISYAEALHADGQNERAEQVLRKAKQQLDHEIASGDEGHLRELGLLLLKSEQTRLAGLAYLEKDYRKVRQDWESALWLAWGKYLNEDYASAAVLGEQILALGLSHPDALLRIGLMYDAAGRKYQAVQMLALGLKRSELVAADVVEKAKQRSQYLREHPEEVRSQFSLKVKQ